MPNIDITDNWQFRIVYDLSKCFLVSLNAFSIFDDSTGVPVELAITASNKHDHIVREGDFLIHLTILSICKFIGKRRLVTGDELIEGRC